MLAAIDKVNPASQPLVSIVTPVYNGSEFLPECIESVLAQTYQNWDYSIVDNCSTDGSVEIARRYAAKDARIRVHQNPQFLRAIPNHNLALRQISPASKYCKVVFADDWIFPECLQKMVALAEGEPSVGIVGAYSLEGRQVTCTGLPYASRVVGGRETCRQHLLNGLYLFGSANSLLYRADLVRTREPFYNEGNIHADTEVCFALLQACDFGFVHQVLTYTRVRPGSLNAVSNDLHSYFAGNLRILGRYGACYLTREELSAQWDKELSEYYRFLSKCLVRRRDKAFWRYHRSQLEELGLRLDWVRLVRATLANLGSAALRPGETIEKLLNVGKRLRAGHGPAGQSKPPASSRQEHLSGEQPVQKR